VFAYTQTQEIITFYTNLSGKSIVTGPKASCLFNCIFFNYNLIDIIHIRISIPAGRVIPLTPIVVQDIATDIPAHFVGRHIIQPRPQIVRPRARRIHFIFALDPAPLFAHTVNSGLLVSLVSEVILADARGVRHFGAPDLPGAFVHCIVFGILELA
jgi:hypothetical protein